MANKQILDYNKLLPSVLKTDNELLTGLVSNLFNRFVSEEKSVSINGRIGRQVEGDAKIVEPSLERQINSLVPAFYYKAGTEETAETFDDLVNKLEVLNTDISNMRNWMAEQSFNFSLPINYDKFVNYANYFWVGQALSNKPNINWNLDLEPEFYVIERPLDNDLVKMPVALATTSNINLYANNRPPEVFTLTFTSSTTFNIVSSISGSSLLPSTTTLVNDIEGEQTFVEIKIPDSLSGINDPNTLPDSLCSFYITNGVTPFSSGDKIIIDITYFTSNIFINFISPNMAGKGSVSGVRTTSALMYIDGLPLRGGERVLVKNQTDAAENGIYRVSVGTKWVKTPDSDNGNLITGSRVYVENGILNKDKTFELQSNSTFADLGHITKEVNNWREYNYWYHKDDLNELIASGYSSDNVVQANRPIIEYSSKLEMNAHYDLAGNPADSGFVYSQTKTRFNQLPLFDLFRYDGTHSGSISSIFYYIEDPDYPVDSVLKRRAKTTPNYDFIFGVCLQDELGRQLYAKKAGTLFGAWQPGVTMPIYTTPVFVGGPDKGSISITINAEQIADNQDWAITALSPSNFSINGSRSGKVGEATVGTNFVCDDLTIMISNGTSPFDKGDQFSFSVHAPLTPRYVKKQPDDSIINYPGWYEGDKSDAQMDGAWMTPLRMFQNLERENKDEIAYGDLMEHFRSVIRNQDGFQGTSFGNNNSRNISLNPGIGGMIREFGSNFPLLASMLLEKDVSPLSIIDFAEQQYLVALSSIDQFINDELADYFATTDTVNVTQIDASDAHVLKLMSYFEELRSLNHNLREVFNDTTAKVKYWPATLPMIGLAPAIQPRVAFDKELGVETIIHHDGHISLLAKNDAEFNRNLVKSKVLRSDGEYTTGMFAENYPAQPYARQLWFKPSTTEVKIFDVDFDSSTTPVGFASKFWYNRDTNILYEWSTVVTNWIISSSTIESRWKIVDAAAIRNSLVLAIENKLFDSVHPSQQINYNIFDASNSDFAKLELARYSAKYNYDTYSPDYNPKDAFTWNYSKANISGMSTVPARWFDVLKNHFDIPGVSLPTCRPNLEPWKLMGYANMPSSWMSTYSANLTTRLWTDAMWVDIKNHFTASGYPNFKLSVDVATDNLLPPYVNAISAGGSEALTNSLFADPNASYVFGDNGPIELIWGKSAEYLYGLARASFRLSPLYFLDKSWGETYTQSNTNLRIERNLQSSLSPSKFLLHGDKLNIINAYSLGDINARFKLSSPTSVTWLNKGVAVFEVTHCADNLTVFTLSINGEEVGLINEGEMFSTPQVDGIQFSNVVIEDLGIPYELGEKITLTFYDDIVDPSYVAPIIPNSELGCDGCVSPDAPADVVVVPMVQVPYDLAHTPANAKKFKGLGQSFTHLLRFSYIDTSVSAATQAYNGWTLKLAHRLGALVRQDTMSINTSLGKLPETAYSVILKKSTNTESKWISALRVQIVKIGSKEMNQYNMAVPVGDASDWVFRVETYNPQHPQAEYYTVDTSNDYQTFFALSKQSTALEWRKFTTHTSIATTTMPLLITGIQNVINFMFGYIDRLTDLGWKVNSDDTPVTDAETGRNLDWQLEVEKFIDRVYRGAKAGQGHILNPFMQQTVLSTPIGLMSKYTESNFIDVYSTQAAFDVTGVVIPVNKLNVIRNDEYAVTYSDTPIFSSHVFIDEFEHAILMNKKFSNEDASVSIFDLFLGLKIDTAYLSYIRQDSMDRKPTFDGFFLSGHDVKRNVSSSIANIGNFYDANKTFTEPSTAEHALALLGYTKKDYFSNIDITDTTQFNFWRGLIQAKGTNMTVDAFVNYKKFSDASVDEYWAYKLAEFGDARERTFPEVKINPGDVTQKFARLQFYSQDDTNYEALPLYTQIENSDDTRWFSLDDLGKGLKFEAQAISETIIVDADASLPLYVRLNNIFHNGDNAAPTISPAIGAEIINSSLVKVTQAGTYVINGFTWLNPSKLSPIKLFDYQENTLIDEIGLWHPAIGLHAANPLEVVNIINKEDPAHYNYTTQTSNNANYRHLKQWAEREVGRVWWDTSNLSYIPYYDATIFPSRDTRHSRWGSLAEWSSVDLYEWTSANVHPSEYDALAAQQEGNAELDKSVRASGKVARKKYYTRNRIISIRPIAWSEAGVGNSNAHPSFGPAESTKVFATSDKLIVDSGRTASANLIAGRNFGGWKNSKPVGEVIIGDAIEYLVGSTFDFTTPSMTPSSNILSSVSVSGIEGTTLGSRIGEIKILKQDNGSGMFVLRMMDSTGFFEDVEVTDWYSTSLETNATKTFNFNKFALALTVTRASAGTDETNSIILLEDLIDAIVNPLNDIVIRESVSYDTIIPLPDTVFINDDTDPDYVTTEYEWKSWNVPSQTDLASDLLAPRNTWMPYLGDKVEVEATSTVVKAMKDSASTLTLRNGIDIERFSSTWSAWVPLLTTKISTISNGVDYVEFNHTETLDSNRLTIYANGIRINPSSYAITDNLVQIASVLPEGTEVLFLYRAYQPTADELGFDPDIKDDVSIQIQYKLDYEYSVLDIRNSDGNITGQKYYFWVQDKTIPAVDKNMSLVQAKSILKSGPSTYTIFSRMIKENQVAAFDSCAVAGLGSLVGKNDSYKLRFLRNFTLRDDPEELNLKNVHTEWALIRKQQRYKIPKMLWDLVTDAACGEDIGGKQLPSQVRIDYDLRNNTRTRFGFKPGQIFADTKLVRESIINTILNTTLNIKIGNRQITDYITALDLDASDTWFSDAEAARNTMSLIWNTARATQINEIFFAVLDDALANNYEFSDIFKTSLITVSSTTQVKESEQWEQLDEQY